MAQAAAFYPDKKVQDGLIEFHKRMSSTTHAQWNLRERMRMLDLAYMREMDNTQENQDARLANRAGDATKIQNMVVPVIKPQIDAAVDYQAAVFLTEYPMFDVLSAPQFVPQAKALKALIEENSIRGNWVREFLLFFHDAFKYNLAAIEVCWDQVVTAAIETDIEFGVNGRPKQVIWSGNRIKRWDMYNTYFDSRVHPYDIPTKAEFCGTTELMSRVALKEFINKLEGKITANINAAFQAPTTYSLGNTQTYGASYYMPRLYDGAIVSPDAAETVNWLAWLGLNRANKGALDYNSAGMYEVCTEYVRIIPSDFDMRVPQRNTPQIWKLIIVNHEVVILAERQTNAHEKIPVLFGIPNDDGLGYQTKSLADDARPFQEISSALMTSVLSARRRAITDRVLYDPSRIDSAHINNPNPSAKIPVRPRAFGTEISKAVYQFPYRDDQSGINMAEIERVVAFGNILNGQNPARQGQFVKGNKTDGQWESVMSNATSKDQRTALLFEAQVFTPLKEILKLNYLQYQSATEIFSSAQQEQVTVDPVALRKAVLNFKITDGVLPKEKLMSTEARKVAMQVIGSSQILAQGYNIAPLFSYIMHMENVDLEPFEKSPQQQAYEQAVNSWMMAFQTAMQKGIPFSVPQPIPQQFGYDPAQQNPVNQRPAPAPGAQGGNQPQ